MKLIAKIPVILLLLLAGVKTGYGQVTGTISVGGDLDKYYPVSFYDGGNSNNVATELEIGRSSVHRDSSWRGSLIARFRYHTYNWGNAAEFINAEMRQNNINNPTYDKFIAGWQDVTYTNSDGKILIWLRGNTTYSYKANYVVTPVVYDGVQHPLPYVQSAPDLASAPTFTYKAAIDAYVNVRGMSYNDAAYFNGSASSYFNGSLGIGKNIPNAKLHVNAVQGTDQARFTQSNVNDTLGCLSIKNGTFTSGHYIPAIIGRSNAPGRSHGIMITGEAEDVAPPPSERSTAAIVLDGRARTGAALATNNVLSVNNYGNNLLMLKADGSLGIGTTDPKGYKLAVAGNMIAEKIKVRLQAGWPDYVFEPGYSLPSLQEVEKYFTANKRLPAIPSAKEIEREGLDVGEMQKLQMQKIEELTLYIIELRKEIDQLKAALK